MLASEAHERSTSCVLACSDHLFPNYPPRRRMYILYISNIFDMVYSFALTWAISEFHSWRQGTCESQFHRLATVLDHRLATVLRISDPYSHPAIHRSQWYSNIQHSVKTQHKHSCIDQLFGISRPRKHPQPDSKTKPPCRYGATCSLTEAFGHKFGVHVSARLRQARSCLVC